jgi:eukaryotic-like serine/threonine-protein kinase
MNSSDESSNLTQSQCNLAQRDRFVDAWCAGRHPSIEGHLDQVPEPDRSHLLRELIAVEVELRRGRGEQPTPAEYKDRFPDHALVDAVFAKCTFACESADASRESPRRSKHDTAYNLLFGMLALRDNFVDRDDLLAAFNVWIANKSRALGRILVDRGSLTEKLHSLVGTLVAVHLKQYGGDVERSLAALGLANPVRRELEGLGDPDLAASLTHVSAVRPGEEDPDATTSWIGTATSIGRRYRILRPHVSGGLGEVFVAYDEELHREVALKEIKPDRANDRESRARFLLEAEVTGRLEHPGIIPVYSLGTDAAGKPFYAMRFIKGQNLKDAIAGMHQSSPGTDHDLRMRYPILRQLLNRFIAICNAVAYAHSRGVLHRDLKPSNILLGPYGETLLVDWGLAKIVGRDEPGTRGGETTLRPSSTNDSGETQPGSAIGTPAYMSPEQAEGKLDQLGPASDVYCLGATLYCLLTGRPPFEGDDVPAILEKVRGCTFPRPREINRSVPLALDAICLKAMSPRPEARYASARALAEDLERWLADEPVSAQREPFLIRVTRWARKRKPLVVGTLALLITAVVALSIGIVAIRIEQKETDNQRVALKKKSDELTQSVEVLRRQDYIHRVNLAYRECQNYNIVLAGQLLAGCPEELRGWEWAHVERQNGGSLRILAEPPGRTWSVAFSPNGHQILCGGQLGYAPYRPSTPVGRVAIWDALTGREVFASRGLRGVVYAVTFSPDGRLFAYGNSLGPAGAQLESWDGGSEMLVRDAATGRERFKINEREQDLLGLAFSPDGKTIAAAHGIVGLEIAVGYVKLWDVATAKEIVRIPGHPGGVTSVAFSADGKQLALASAGLVEVYDLKSNKSVRILRGPTSFVYSVSFSPDGKTLAAGGWDQTIRLWDRATGREIRTFYGHNGGVRSIAFSPDSRHILSASEDRSLRLWEVATGRELSTLRGHTGFVSSVAYSPDGESAVSGAFGDDGVRLWYAGANYKLIFKGPPGVYVDHVAFSPSGRWLATKHRDVIKIWNPTTAELVRSIDAGSSRYQCGIAFTPDGNFVASAGLDTTIKIWNAATGQRIKILRGHTKQVWGIAFSSDGRLLASASEDRTVKIWDVERSEVIRTLVERTDPVYAVAFAPDGRMLAAGTVVGTVKIWDVQTGRNLRTMPGQEMIRTLAFSPDGRLLASGTSRPVGPVKLWDPSTGVEVVTLLGHTGTVYGLAFSADGKRLATASSDGTAKLWNVATGDEVFTLRGHAGEVMDVAFSPGGERLVSGGADGIAVLWDTVPTPIEVLREREAVALVESLANQGITLKGDLIQRLRSDATIREPLRSAAVEIARRWDIHKDWLTMRTSEIETRIAAQNARDVVGTLQLYQKVLARRQALVAEYLDDSELRSDQALAHQAIANLHFHAGRLTEALREFQRVNDIYETLTRLNPNATGYAWALAWSNWQIGIIHHRLSQPAEALRYYERTRDLFENLIKSDPNGHLIYTMDLLYGYMGELYRATGRLPEASRSFERALELDEIRNPEKKNPTILMKRARHQLNLGHLRGVTGRPTEALRLFHQAQEILEGFPDGGANDLYNLTCAYSLVSDVVGRSKGTPSPGDHAESQRIADLAVATLRRAVLAGWKNLRHANQDTDLDPLRSRADFRAVMMDMAFPDRPFAR